MKASWRTVKDKDLKSNPQAQLLHFDFVPIFDAQFSFLFSQMVHFFFF